MIGSLLNHIQLFALAIAMTVTPLIAPAQTPNAKSLAIKAQDLLPFSQKCQDTYRRPPICENRSTILKSRLVGAATDLQSIKEGIVREDFQEKLMNVYYQKAYQNMADRYAAIVSMSGKDFIQDSPRDFESYLKVAKCAKASSLEQSKMNFKERLKNARSADPFNLKGLAKEDLAILKDLELKKFVLATIALRGEMTKIKATGSKEDLPAMKEFLMPDPGRVAIDPRAIENVFKILEHYPLLTMDENHLTR